jgi:hypothetical protein
MRKHRLWTGVSNVSMDTEQMTKNIPASSGKQQKKQHPTPPAHSRAIRGIIIPAIWEIPIIESLV